MVSQGVRVAQSVEHPTRDFGSGLDLTVHGIEPQAGLHTDRTELAWDSLSPALSAPPPLVHSHACVFSLSLSLKINRLKKQKQERLGGSVG